jgi:hypothetical protein
MFCTDMYDNPINIDKTIIEGWQTYSSVLE